MLLTKYLQSFLMFALGTLSCFYLQKIESVSAVLASALIGLMATFLPLKKLKMQIDGVSIIYCGSFAGMCSSYYLISLSQVLLLSLIGALVVSFLENIIDGHGGKLGFMAFISVLFFVLIGRIL